MRKQGGGSIVNATTGAGKVPESSRLPTSVSRAAGLNLTKSMANEFAKDKIRINAICIGKIKSAQ
jgi:NAD(P)-dependent dehydrogenase (short-subunit alcohol dehydrogenase family)